MILAKTLLLNSTIDYTDCDDFVPLVTNEVLLAQSIVDILVKDKIIIIVTQNLIIMYTMPEYEILHIKRIKNGIHPIYRTSSFNSIDNTPIKVFSG